MNKTDHDKEQEKLIALVRLGSVLKTDSSEETEITLSKVKDEFQKMYDDLNVGRYPWRFIYLCQDAGCSQEYIDVMIRNSYKWISERPAYNIARGWKESKI